MNVAILIIFVICLLGYCYAQVKEKQNTLKAYIRYDTEKDVLVIMMPPKYGFKYKELRVNGIRREFVSAEAAEEFLEKVNSKL